MLTLRQGQSLTIDDFELITVIGKGSFGKVRLLGCVLVRMCVADMAMLLLGDASSQARHRANLRAQDDPQAVHRPAWGNHAHARGAARPRAREQPLHRAAQVLLPVRAEAVPCACFFLSWIHTNLKYLSILFVGLIIV